MSKAFASQADLTEKTISFGEIGGYALIAAILAAAWPALRLARTPPATLLKVFANER